MRVVVDQDKCLGNGFCEAIPEDLFDLGDRAVVRVVADTVPEERRAEMEQAVAQCPVDALTLHRD